MASIEAIRTKGEASLGRAMRGLNARYRQKIKAAIKQHGGVDKIPESFWQKMQQDIDTETGLVLLLMWNRSHESPQNKLGFTADRAGVEQAGSQFAQGRAGTLATQYVEHTKERLKTAATTAESAKDMDVAVNTALSTARADGVAATETTAAISGGQGQGGEDYKAARPGEEISVLWVTRKDAIVCPICRPLHMTGEEVWGEQFPNGPPAHPNCRCQTLIVKGAVRPPRRKRPKAFSR